MKTSIIIPTFNREEVFNKSLAAIEAASKNIDSEIIIVNDNKGKEVKTSSKTARVYNNPGKGVSAARNFGFSVAKGKNILFIDNDILPTEESLITLLNHLEKNTNCCFNPNWRFPDSLMASMKKSKFGRFMLNRELYNYKSWFNGEWNETEVFESPVLSGFCLALPAKAMEETKGFNESITYITEDDEFSIRLKEKGYKLFIDPTIHVFHNEEDRQSLGNKMHRMYLTGAARKRAERMGLSGYNLEYPKVKKKALIILVKLEFLLRFSAYLIPNMKALDRVYALFIHVLLAINIFKGYFSKV